jgi:hypothetical protein
VLDGTKVGSPTRVSQRSGSTCVREAQTSMAACGVKSQLSSWMFATQADPACRVKRDVRTIGACVEKGRSLGCLGATLSDQSVPGGARPRGRDTRGVRCSITVHQVQSRSKGGGRALPIPAPAGRSKGRHHVGLVTPRAERRRINHFGGGSGNCMVGPMRYIAAGFGRLQRSNVLQHAVANDTSGETARGQRP